MGKTREDSGNNCGNTDHLVLITCKLVEIGNEKKYGIQKNGTSGVIGKRMKQQEKNLDRQMIEMAFQQSLALESISRNSSS